MHLSRFSALIFYELIVIKDKLHRVSLRFMFVIVPMSVYNPEVVSFVITIAMLIVIITCMHYVVSLNNSNCSDD